MDKRVVEVDFLFTFGEDKKEHLINLWAKWIYTDEEDFVVEYNSFDELLTGVKKGKITGAEVKKSIFTKKEYVKIMYHDTLSGEVLRITEKNFKPFKFIVRLDKKQNKSFKTLSEMLSAEDFIEYLKDRGITKI